MSQRFFLFQCFACSHVRRFFSALCLAAGMGWAGLAGTASASDGIDGYYSLWPDDMTPDQKAAGRQRGVEFERLVRRWNAQTKNSGLLPEGIYRSKKQAVREHVEQHARRLGIPLRQVIVADNDRLPPEFANRPAFAFPEHGYVMISDVLGASDGDATAFLLAHEWGHLALSHRPRRALLGYLHWQAKCTPKPCKQKDIAFRTGMDFLDTPEMEQVKGMYFYDQELEADTYAAFLLSKAGYKVVASEVLLRVIERFTPRNAAEDYGEPSVDHPSVMSRINSLDYFEHRGIPLGTGRAPPFPLPPEFNAWFKLRL